MATKKTKTEKPAEKPAESVIFVGQKPMMAYVLAVTTQMRENTLCVLKARGHAISKAIDAVEVSRNRYIPDIQVVNVSIGTDKVGEGKDSHNVSSIEITIKR